MFKLFQKENQIASDVMDVVKKEYPKIVQEIHREFLTAGDVLLKNSNDLLDTLSVPNKEKVEKLKQFGFHQTKQVKETIETQKKINEQKRISDAVSEFRVKYPNYKYITTEIADSICKKYNLVLGSVTLYKGFVPKKNIDDIANFFEFYPKDEIVYFEKTLSRSVYSEDRIRIITEDEYIKQTKPKEKVTTDLSTIFYQQSAMQANMPMQQNVYYMKEKAPLAICAPLKDMNTEGMKLEGNKLVKYIAPIPDPVVLFPKNHSNGIEGYLILTAWGDEASDPLVINENNN